MSDAVNGSKYAPVPGRIPGQAINLGGVDLVFAPLNLDGVQAFIPLQAKFKETVNDLPSLTAIVAEALLLSLHRNYPDMTQGDVVALLDVGNLETAMDALAAASGFKKAAAGESPPASK